MSYALETDIMLAHPATARSCVVHVSAVLLGDFGDDTVALCHPQAIHLWPRGLP